MLFPRRKHLKRGEKVSLSLPLAQVDLIVERTSIGGELLAVLHAAKVHDNVVVARCTLAHLDRLAIHIESEASGAKDGQFQSQLFDISTAIRKLKGAYFDDSIAQEMTPGQRRPRACNTNVSIGGRVKGDV